MHTKLKLSSLKPNTLYETTDYEAFELCEFNREVSRTRPLRDSMLKHGFISAYPIHARFGGSGSLVIIGGHHRFHVAQDLGIPIWFILSNDSGEIHEMEAATNSWSGKDYLASFAKLGKEPYVIVEEYYKRTGIPISICISLLSGESATSGNWIKRFKSGAMEIRGQKFAEEVASLVSYCESFGVDASRSLFVIAISRCLRVSQFNVQIFRDRVRVNAGMFSPQRSLTEQMKLFETVYNFKASAGTRLPLAFLAEQEMKSRAVCK